MARKHVMTAARRSALRKAQLASARSRRRVGNMSPRTKKTIKRTTIAVGVVGTGVALYAGGRSALNNPAKWGGAGRKLDTAITYGYYHGSGMSRLGISWQAEKAAHDRRSLTTVRSFTTAAKRYQQGKKLMPRDKIIYREYTHQRAVHRLRRIKGEKTVRLTWASTKPNRALRKKLRGVRY